MSDTTHVPGPWDNEPDQEQWEHNGLQCAILRVTHSGHLCGYVGIGPDHPWHGKKDNENVPWPNAKDLPCDVDNIGILNLLGAGGKADLEHDLVAICLILRAHGGITFAAGHKGYPIDHDGLWWFGFDCNHLGDYAPYDTFREGKYRDFEYVKAETNNLAEQLADVAKIALEVGG